MKGIDKTVLDAADKAIVAGTALGEIITPEWLAGHLSVKVAELPLKKNGKPEAINLSQIWQYHTRLTIVSKAGVKRCEHCVRELGGKDITDLVPVGDNEVAASKAIVRALGQEAQSWGLVMARLGNNGMPKVGWSEGRVRKVYEAGTGVQSRGLRPTHSGGRWVADCMELYREEHAVGTMEDGVRATDSDKLNALIEAAKGTQKERTPEQYEKLVAEREARKRAHDAAMRKLLAERKAASK